MARRSVSFSSLTSEFSEKEKAQNCELWRTFRHRLSVDWLHVSTKRGRIRMKPNVDPWRLLSGGGHTNCKGGCSVHWSRLTHLECRKVRPDGREGDGEGEIITSYR